MSVMCPLCGYGPAALSPSVAERRHEKHHYPWAHGVLLPPDHMTLPFSLWDPRN